MYEIFEKLMKEKGVRPAEVAKATGLRKAFFSDWKMGRGNPKADKLQILADYFEVPLSYMVTGKMDGMDMSEEEMMMVHRYRKLNDYGKEALLEMLDTFLSVPKYTQKNSSRSEVV